MRPGRKPAPVSRCAVLWANPLVAVPFRTATVTNDGRTEPVLGRRWEDRWVEAEVVAGACVVEVLDRVRTTPTATAARTTAATATARITRPRPRGR